ncbi:MAG: hypothetical protein ACRD3L_08000 [Terriglobales bacterium]
MKHLCIAITLSMALAWSGCGNNSGSGSTINGNWTAILTGSQDLNLSVTLTQSSGSAVTVSNLSFTTSQSCFDTGASATGAFSVTGTTNGVTTGSFVMTIVSGASNSNGMNQLMLQGTLTNNSITGTWNLSGTGAGCTGSGTFTMAD